MDTLFLLPILAGLSIVILLARAFGPPVYKWFSLRVAAWRGYEPVVTEEQGTADASPAQNPSYMPSEGLYIDFINHIRSVGVVPWVFELLRLLLIITLLTLSIYAAAVAHIPIAHRHEGVVAVGIEGENEGWLSILKGKGRHGGKRRKHKNRKAELDFVKEEWLEFGNTVFYVSSLYHTISHDCVSLIDQLVSLRVGVQPRSLRSTAQSQGHLSSAKIYRHTLVHALAGGVVPVCVQRSLSLVHVSSSPGRHPPRPRLADLDENLPLDIGCARATHSTA